MCKKKEGCMEQYFGLSKEFAFRYLGEQPKPDQPVQILLHRLIRDFAVQICKIMCWIFQKN